MISQMSGYSLVTVDEEPMGGTNFKAWISVVIFTLMVWIIMEHLVCPPHEKKKDTEHFSILLLP